MAMKSPISLRKLWKLTCRPAFSNGWRPSTTLSALNFRLKFS